MVSRKHAELRWHDGKWILVDLNSSYGTFIDGRRVTAPERISAGQRLQFGQDGPVMKVVWFEVLSDSQPLSVSQQAEPVSIPGSVQSQIKTEVKADSYQIPHVQPPVASPATGKPAAGPGGARIEFVTETARAPFDLSAQGIAIGRDPACD